MGQGQEWKTSWKRRPHNSSLNLAPGSREGGRGGSISGLHYIKGSALNTAMLDVRALTVNPSKPVLPSIFYTVISSCFDSHTVACSSALILGETKQGWGRISPRGNTVDAIMQWCYNAQPADKGCKGKGQSGKYAKEWFKTIQDFKSVIKWNGQSI